MKQERNGVCCIDRDCDVSDESQMYSVESEGGMTLRPADPRLWEGMRLALPLHFEGQNSPHCTPPSTYWWARQKVPMPTRRLDTERIASLLDTALGGRGSTKRPHRILKPEALSRPPTKNHLNRMQVLSHPPVPTCRVSSRLLYGTHYPIPNLTTYSSSKPLPIRSLDR